MNKRLGVLYEGATAPSASHERKSPDFWLDNSGATPVLKIKNKAGNAWIAIDVAAADVSALGAKLIALDAAATALTALPTDLATNLSTTLAAADVDTAAELAVILNAMCTSINTAATRVNAIATDVNALTTAIKAVGA